MKWEEEGKRGARIFEEGVEGGKWQRVAKFRLGDDLRGNKYWEREEGGRERERREGEREGERESGRIRDRERERNR